MVAPPSADHTRTSAATGSRRTGPRAGRRTHAAPGDHARTISEKSAKADAIARVLERRRSGAVNTINTMWLQSTQCWCGARSQHASASHGCGLPEVTGYMPPQALTLFGAVCAVAERHPDRAALLHQVWRGSGHHPGAMHVVCSQFHDPHPLCL